MIDRDADVLERDARVEQPLDDLENEDVLERVQSLTTGARRATDRRHDQVRAGPVVELAVAYSGDLTCDGGDAITDQLVGNRIVREQTRLDVVRVVRRRHRGRVVPFVDIDVPPVPAADLALCDSLSRAHPSPRNNGRADSPPPIRSSRARQARRADPNCGFTQSTLHIERWAATRRPVAKPSSPTPRPEPGGSERGETAVTSGFSRLSP